MTISKTDQDQCGHQWQDREVCIGGHGVYVGGSGVQEGYGHPIDWDTISEYRYYRECTLCGRTEELGTHEERYEPYYEGNTLRQRRV